MSELHPIGHELGVKNLHIIARRTGWPDGAADACERFDNEHPGWESWWGTGRTDQPARPGFYAVREHKTWGEPPAYGATIDDLAAAVAAWPYQDVKQKGPVQWIEPSKRRD